MNSLHHEFLKKTIFFYAKQDARNWEDILGSASICSQDIKMHNTWKNSFRVSFFFFKPPYIFGCKIFCFQINSFNNMTVTKSRFTNWEISK